MKAAKIEIIGDSLEALAVIAALNRLEVPYRWLVPESSKDIQVKQLKLNATALSIIYHLFPKVQLSEHGHPLTQSLIYCHYPSTFTDCEIQDQLSIDHSILLQLLTEELAKQGIKPQTLTQDQPPGPEDNWQIYTGPHHPDELSDNQYDFSFGHRVIQTALVELSSFSLVDSCTLELTEYGWLQLLPHCTQLGTLYYCGLNAPSIEHQLKESILITQQIGQILCDPLTSYCQKISFPISGLSCNAGWLRLSEQFNNFDLLDDNKYTVILKAAINAAAALESIISGRIEKTTALMYYQSMLVRQFLEHANKCVKLYHKALTANPDWTAELSRILLNSKALKATFNPDHWLEGRKMINGRLY